MLQDKYKYSITNNGNQDYYLNIMLCSVAKNVGYLQYVSNEQNVHNLITSEGQLSTITLENPTEVPPVENTDPYFNLISNSIITGITDSNLITQIRSYDKNNPYPIGSSKVLDGKVINIIDYTPNLVHYKVDSIAYITYLNKNIYNETLVVNNSLSSTYGTKGEFIIPTDDKYAINVSYTSYSSTTNSLVLFLNGIQTKTYPLPSGKVVNAVFESEFESDDKLGLYISSSTNNVLPSSITYNIRVLDVDDESRYVTYYFFGNKTLNSTNTQDGFIYKSDKQHYHDKPIINNGIKVGRNNVSVFKNLFDLGIVNYLEDIKF